MIGGRFRGYPRVSNDGPCGGVCLCVYDRKRVMTVRQYMDEGGTATG